MTSRRCFYSAFLFLILGLSSAHAATVHSLTCGMIGDGSTNNYTAFNTCQNSATANGTVPGTIIVDATSSFYNGATSNTSTGFSAGFPNLVPNLTIQCASGAKFGTTASPVIYAFAGQQHVQNVTITGCEFIGIGAFTGQGIASDHQIQGVTITNNNIHDLVKSTSDAGIRIFGILNGFHFDNNTITDVWQNGYPGNSFAGLFGSSQCQAAGPEACDFQGQGIAVVGYLNNGSINGNRIDLTGNDGIILDFRPGGYSNLYHIPGGGNLQVMNNNVSRSQRFGMEFGGFQAPYDPPDNFSIPIVTNLQMTGNWIHDEPGGWWLIDGYSIVMNGANNMQFENNTWSTTTATPQFGNYAVGNAFEVGANLWTFRNNVATTVGTVGNFENGTTFLQGNADAFSAQASGVVPKLTTSNNYICSLRTFSVVYGNDGNGQWTPCPGGTCSNANNGFSPVTRTADAVIFGSGQSCRNNPNVSSSNISVPVFTSPNNQNITSGSGTWNVQQQSILSVRQMDFLVDGGSSPVVTQVFADTNPAFSLTNLNWLYHATFSTASLANGTHTLSARATDVSGATSTATQNFTVGGGACSIPFVNLPSGTQGTPYTTTVASSGCTSGTWTVSAGALPGGLSLSNTTSTTVTISGTPTMVQNPSFSLSFSTAPATAFTINIGAPVSCNTATQNVNNGLYSDTFLGGCLSNIWTLYDPLGGGMVSVGAGGATISNPSTTTGKDNYLNGNQATLITQNLQGNADFNATVKFTTAPTTAYSSEGIVAMVDNFNSIRCEVLGNSSGTLQGVVYYVAGNASGTTPTPLFEGNFTNGTPVYVQLARAGSNWTCSASHDGATYTTLAAFTQALNIAKIGIVNDTGVNGASAPAWSLTAQTFTIAGSSAGGGGGTTGNPWGQTPVTFPVTGGTATCLSNFIPAGQSITCTPTVAGAWSLVSGSVGTISNASSVGTYTAPASVAPQHVRAGCMVGPPDSIFNTRIDSLSVNTNSAQWTDTTTMHTIDGMPLTPASPVAFTWQTPFATNIIDNTVAPTTMTYFYTTLQNGTTIQIPPTPNLREGGTYAFSEGTPFVDHHGLTVNHANCNLQETYQDGIPIVSCPLCKAASGFQYLATGYALPSTSPGGGAADAAGFPMQAMIMHLSELKAGAILHALRYTTGTGYITLASFLWPASTKNGGDNTFSQPMGARMRLKSSVSPGGLNTYATTIVTALKRYGAFVADNGTNNAFTVDSDLSTDPTAVTALQQLTGILHMGDFEFVDESGNEITAGSLEVPVALATGPAAQLVFTPSPSGATTTFGLALQAITVGLPFDQATILAGEPAYTVPYWTNGDPTNAGATWAISACSLGGVNCGTITTTGAYTPPATITAGTYATATLTGTSVTDTSQSANLYLKIVPAGTLYVDSGATVPFTDNSSHVWLPDAFGWQVENFSYPFDSDLVDPNGLWQQGYARGVSNITLWQTGEHGLGGANGAGDMYLQPVIVPNGVYDLKLLFGLTGQNNGTTACWGSYMTTLGANNFQAIGPLNLVANGTLQAHSWNYGIPAHLMCRTPTSVDIPAVVSNRVLTATIATDNTAFYEPFLNGYSIGAYGGAPTWTLDTQQTTSLQPGNQLQLYVQNWTTGITDPVWSITNGPGTITTNGLYQAPSTQAFTGPVNIKACSSSVPTVCGSAAITIIGTKFASF